LAILKLRYKSF